MFIADVNIIEEAEMDKIKHLHKWIRDTVVQERKTHGNENVSDGV